MPTYEYECKSCGHNFEAFQSMSDAPLTECPECGKEIRRLINGGGGIIFKGSGFYVNDKKTDKKNESSKTASSKPEQKSGDVRAGETAGGTAGSAGTATACASCPAAAASGGSCPASEKAAG